MKEVLIAGVFTIIGGGIGAIATYMAAIRTSQQQRHNAATTKFRSTIISEITSYIRQTPGVDFLVGDLEASYRVVQAAIFEYSFFLDDMNRNLLRSEITPFIYGEGVNLEEKSGLNKAHLRFLRHLFNILEYADPAKSKSRSKAKRVKNIIMQAFEMIEKHIP
ncbi:MAG TPA: hypothetical protein DHV36_20155 [Desulfobacteraceae bacterium]|nr:hypothetical protein [Desulfobacteraceae bacterium]|tara:strand:- start:205 stop:693 length:489 start_codon:yes stop_codon:yes gene_type:complete